MEITNVQRALLLKAFTAQAILFTAFSLGIAWWRGWVEDLGLNFGGYRSLLAGLAAGAMMGATSVACDRFGLKSRTTEEISLALGPGDILFVNLALIAPSEEILFRGLLVPRIGLIPSSIAFGLAHVIGYRAWGEVVVATSFGLLLGWLFLHTGSLFGPWLAHALANIISMNYIRRRKS
ncbi:MAG: CPBP family intramembrane metalloprotease [Hadesarchaea archaeon]|nr:CPBP family intramembrane metalloprotease [Hadesarchaea archaeon]